MLASLLRPRERRGQLDPTPFSSPFTPSDSSPWLQAAAQRGLRRARGADNSDDDDDDDAPELQEIDEEVDEDWIGDEDEDEEDGPVESTPLLPIFSASHLGTFPLSWPRVNIDRNL